MSMKELVVYAVFIAVIIFICFHFMQRRDFGTSWRLTADEQHYITKELKRKGARDCVLTPAEYGWRCEDMRTGKIYKVKM